MVLMRKSFFCCCFLVIFLSFFTTATYSAEVKVYNNRQLINFSDEKPYIDTSGRLLVPLRMISEEMGADVSWDGETETITIISHSPRQTISMKIADNFAQINGQNIALDTPPVISSTGRVMVPARFLCNLLGVEVKWNPADKIIQMGDISSYAQKIPVLMYHHLLRDADIMDRNNGAILAVEDFKGQMAYLHENNFYTATLEELEKFIKGELLLPDKTVVITFDDGYQSNIIYGYPILKEFNFQGSIFVITSLEPEATQDFVPGILSHLSLAEMEKTKDVFEFASHSHDLHKLDSKGKSYLISQPREVIIEDLQFSRDKLNTRAFAYPYGQYTKETIDILQSLGYNLAFTINKGYTKPHDNPYKIKRFGITPKISLEKFKSIVELKEE